MLRRSSSALVASSMAASSSSSSCSEKISSTLQGTEDTASLLSQFDQQYDDSSDEEESHQKITRYDINQKWLSKQSAKGALPKKTMSMQHDDLLSFVAHAAGLKIFYSSEVAEIYYPLKKTLLNHADQSQLALNELERVIEQCVMQSIKLAMQETIEFVSVAKTKAYSVKTMEKDIEAFLPLFKKDFHTLYLKRCQHFVNWLKAGKLHSQESYPPEIKKFIDEAHALFLELLQNYYQLNHTVTYHTEQKEALFQEANQEIRKIIDVLDIEHCENSAGKAAAIELLEHNRFLYTNTMSAVTVLLKQAPSRGLVKTILNKILEEPSTKMLVTRAFLQDLIILVPQKKYNQKISSSAIDLFKAYYTFDLKTLCDELSSQFYYCLNAQLQCAIYQVNRPILGNHHTFVSCNPYQFYANLRLSNRNQKRAIKNGAKSFFPGAKVSRAWRFGALKSQQDAIEIQEILQSSLGRKDRVESLGNYQNVYEIIEKIKSYSVSQQENIDDKYIATAIRDIFNGRIPILPGDDKNTHIMLHKLQAITYLLLGCEAVRNPAMHVVNQMLLDLIIDSKDWDFSKAFVDNLMPMAPEGAVSIARSLESSYRYYLPYAYFYRGIEDKDNSEYQYSKNQLSQSEARIVRDWVKLKYPSMMRCSGEKLPERLLYTIENHVNHWIYSIAKEEDTLASEMTAMHL